MVEGIKVILHSIYFGSTEYVKMARALKVSAETHLPYPWFIKINQVSIPEIQSDYKSKYITRKDFFISNAYKSLVWCDIIEKANMGDEILLIDVDTYIREDLTPIWSERFDVAITTRDYKWPINSGVIFVKVNADSKKFFSELSKMTQKLLDDPILHSKMEDKYGGIHQAALGAVLESIEGVNILKLPCEIWNSGHLHRDKIENAKIVHLLPEGRKVVFGNQRISSRFKLLKQDYDTYLSEIKWKDRWDAIIERLEPDSIVVEVGVWKGDLSEKLLESNLVSKLYLVDPWLSGIPNTSWYNSSSKMPRLPQSFYDKVKTYVKGRAARFGDRVEIIELPSIEAAQLFDDLSVDFVFIDADHSQEGLSQDIDIWMPKVKLDGYIGGHDFNDSRFPGVKKAVENYFGSSYDVDDDFTWFHRIMPAQDTQIVSAPINIFSSIQLIKG